MNDGGPAFPGERIVYSGGLKQGEEHFPGMTLRDWFAGMALQAVARYDPTDEDIRASVEGAYRYADKMLIYRGPKTP